QNDFDREYLYYVLGSEFVLTQYKSMASGSSVLNLNKEVVKNVLIDCPQTLEEQTRISSILGQMDSEIESLEGQLAKAKSLKQGMMQQLLTGKIRLV
ncbi:MAG TPA: restriction endonuclease subunit S, partial [Catalimonadaceae bacterium]|nr:restriction endonuclease subunit S [Catalimonadaceae bacterium]